MTPTSYSSMGVDPVPLIWREHNLPQIVDDLARRKPDQAYGLWPIVKGSTSAGFQALTYSQLANIVNRLAWWLIEQLGPERHGEVLAYVGPNDVRYTALVLATVKTGFRLFLTSPRNSSEAHRKLFDRLNCRTLITPDPLHQPAVSILKSVKPCRSLAIPSISDLIQAIHNPYIMDKSLNKSRRDTLFIIHTSGSTGIPKPLEWTQETAIRQTEASSRGPPAKGAGLFLFLMHAIPFGNIIIIPSVTGAMVTARGVVDALKQTSVEVAVMVPSTIAELAQDPELLDYCAQNLHFILYVGGDLPQAIGDTVASKIPLHPWWGASEVGMPHQLIVPELRDEDWHYIRFHPCTGATFEEVSDGHYELVIRRRDEILDTQTTFSIVGFEDKTEYRTSDLFQPHPEVPNLWRWQGRADDIIVFLNGEKTNPVSMEQHIVASNPDVISGAIVIGNQRFQTALIIDPTSHNLTTAEQASLIERVWPSVVDANNEVPAHARVEKSLILITQQPFIRTGKGTVQRAATVAQYATEIEKLYTDADVSLTLDGESDQQAHVMGVEAAVHLVRNTICAMTSLAPMGDSENFFESGMDSLQALQLVRAMRRALGNPHLALSAVYQNPTPRQFAASALSNTTEGYDDRVIAEQLLRTYRGLIRQIPRKTSPRLVHSLNRDQAGSLDVLLTGSTGTLGTSILYALLRHSKVGHIFCLNRSADGGRMAQYGRFTAAQLSTDMLDNHVTFIRADLVDPKLGLDDDTYRMLTARVGLLLHNAWPVNFNFSLLAFRPLLAGLVNLFKFAADVTLPGSQLLFISSVSTVAGVGSAAPTESVPDETIEAALPNGYARSKLLGELLCDSAARQLGTRVLILRVGQVGGSTTGHGAIWNRAEWLPSLVISSARSLNCLPNNLGPHFHDVDWVPSDLLGAVVVDIALATPTTAVQETGAEVFNVRNPCTTDWGTLIPSIQEVVKARFGQDMKVVSPTVWLKCLQESEEGAGSETVHVPLHELMINNPAAKLFSFYRNGLWPQEIESTTPYSPMVISKAVSTSDTLRDMPAVSPEWMQKWTREWIDDEGPTVK
ncbi:acetyl-CoA synthetase-like protein [Xylaria arbuscula]|nr:acetyl-CoA synthetase-like protein [Xylaria arbuscula]